MEGLEVLMTQADQVALQEEDVTGEDPMEGDHPMEEVSLAEVVTVDQVSMAPHLSQTSTSNCVKAKPEKKDCHALRD